MVATSKNEPNAVVSSKVEALYDSYPFPPDPLIDGDPVGYNWRWHYPSAYAFCTGRAPSPLPSPLRILDAGCGTGCGTEYLVHLNPTASVMGIDLSAGALAVATDRLTRSVGEDGLARTTFEHRSIFDVADLPGSGFDHINCVGVVHHTPDPLRAVRALAAKLNDGGILHLFVYASHGRWEISLMQQAISLLQPARGGDTVDYNEGVRIGRELFAKLPGDNRLVKREASRWSQENKRDATFADMYVHPQEVDYDIPSLFELIDQSGLDFLGFSNPGNFDLARILGNTPELLERAQALPEREQYRLVELLDPDSVTHFEFFLGKAVSVTSWDDDEALLAAKVSLSECTHGWPAMFLFDRDYMPVELGKAEHAFLTVAVDGKGASTVRDAVEASGLSLDVVRELRRKAVIVLAEA